ncbi:MAG TPA: murein biosynthesis integral membrane protein MurJ [Planctomycetota bacterium]|nr:murein biosynthesis integral membrane protein MurJ [Planctomycetota bacterium]
MSAPASRSAADLPAGGSLVPDTGAGSGAPPRASAADEKHFLHSAWTVSALTSLSRVLGLVRDTATTWLLGAGPVSDALTWAWSIPNMFRRLFGEGALSSAFMPIYTRVLEKEGVARARQVSNQVISTLAIFLTLVAAALALVMLLVSPQMLADWTGKDVAKAELMLRYTALLTPYLAFICIIAQFMGVMNVMGEFAVPALASVILNLMWVAGVIAAAWLLGTTASSPTALEALNARQGYVIAIAILISGVLQFLWHLPGLRRLGIGFAFTLPRRSAELTAVLIATGPMLIGMGAVQINILIDRAVAETFLSDGAVTHLYYGQRLMQFPQGVVSAALVSAVFPALARMSARGDRKSVVSTTSLAIRVNSLLTLPAAVGFMVLAAPIVSLLFEHGHFDASASALTGRALIGFSLGIPFAGLNMLLTRAFYASGDVKAPMRIALCAVAVNIALDFLLVHPLGELGLALATSVATAVNSWMLLAAFRARMNLPREERLLSGLAPALGLTALMGVVVWGVDFGVARAAAAAGWPAGGMLMLGARCGAGMGAGLAVYLGLAGRLCPREWNELSRLWRRRPAA